MTTVSTTLDEVKDIIVKTLDIEDPRRVGDARTPLFGGIPELDSFAVISLAMALEERFGFEIADSDFTADVFDTVGSLADFVDRNRRSVG